MKRYQFTSLKEVIGNLDFKGKRVGLGGIVSGLCYRPGNFIRSTRFAGFLEQDGLIMGFSGEDHFDTFYATRLLKAGSETKSLVDLKGKLKYSQGKYELKVSGISSRGINFRS